MPVRRLASLLLAITLALGACSDGDSGESQRRPPPTEIDLVVTTAELVSPHRVLSPLAEPVRGEALGVVQAAFDATVVGPAQGEPAGDLDDLFSPGAAAQATEEDRSVVFDEELPTVTPLVAEKADVQLTALAGQDDQPVLVVARLDWDVRSSDGSVRVHRTGELSLTPVDGKWQIGAYDLKVTRTLPDGTTSTTEASS